MDRYLSNYMESVSTRQSVKLADVIDEIKLSKATLPAIAKTVEKLVTDSAPVILSNQEADSLISSGQIEQNIRNLRQTIKDLYQMSNYISLLLENSTLLLHSETAALEDDLIAMEKAVESFVFLLNSKGAYNFAYLETFSDDTGRDPMIECPDRASLRFGPGQLASIDTEEGALVLPKNQISSYGLSRKVLATNATVKLDSRPTNTKSWRAVVETASPITATIPEASGHTGAQAMIEYRLAESAPTSEVKIAPYSDTPLTLVSVRGYKNQSDNVGFEILTKPVYLDQPKTLYFPLKMLQRVRIVVNQPTYNRVSVMSTAEDEYRVAYESLQARLKELKDNFSYNTSGDFNHFLYMILWYLKGFKAHNRMAMPKVLPKEYTGDAGIPALVEAIKRASRPRGRYKLGLGSPIGRRDTRPTGSDFELVEFVKHMFKKKDELYNMLAQREVDRFEDMLKAKGIYDPQGVMSPIQMIYQNGWVYRYALGIENVLVGVSSTGFKGFHVTRQLESHGDVGEVAIKVQDFNYRDTNAALDNSVLTSIEYSVSNKSEPDSESDWIPILPLETNLVESERLFPDDTGKCLLRFPADISESLSAYKNGISLEIPNNNFIYDGLNQSVIGVRIPVLDYKPEDMLTITYVPARDFTKISFADYGFGELPLLSAFDEKGAGEGFSQTVGKEVALAFDPYIDYARAAEATYSSTHGTIPYQPITIRLAGGTVATNLTNYTNSGEQAALPTNGVYFIQSGNNIVFNVEITEPFRVYYQFLQNNLRVRTVLRCNSKNFVSPMVFSVHARGKTRRPNSKGLL